MPRSSANGPGIRTVIWLQGCALGCPGCFNPQTHAHEPRIMLPVEALLAGIQRDQSAIQGITISGGEPLEQPSELLELLRGLRARTNLSIILFTGHSMDELSQSRTAWEIVSLTDVLIAGRFVENQRLPAGLRGSSNQEVHFITSRYDFTDLREVPIAEIAISSDGRVMVSGLDPPRLVT